MPYVSKAQQGYFNANRDKLEGQGVNIGEWNAASKGKKLPARVHDGKPVQAIAANYPMPKKKGDR